MKPVKFSANYFTEIKKESKWEGHSVVIHDSSNVSLFEVITQKLQEKNE